MKRNLSAAALALCLALTLLPVPALAGESRPLPRGWTPSASEHYFNSLAPFAPSDPDNEAEVAYAKLSNLLWLAWLMREEFVLPFTDVPQDSWFYPGVCFVYQQSLMGGVSETSFAPQEPVTRGMAWTVLARMNCVDTAPSPGAPWYEPGMTWAVERGVTDGSNPQGVVTREQWVSMLWRRACCPESGDGLSAFSDHAQISGYARDAMGWAVSQGIVVPFEGRLSPKSPVSRGELAVMIARYAA